MEDIDLILPTRACRTIPTDSAWIVQWTAPRDIKAGETVLVAQLTATNDGPSGNKFKHFAKFDSHTTRVFEMHAPDAAKPIRRKPPGPPYPLASTSETAQ